MLALLLVGLAQAAPPAPPQAALDAFVLDFGEDGARDPGGERVAALYQAACEAGHALSCDWERWRGGDREAVLEPAQATCDRGDPLGCVVAGWMWGSEEGGTMHADLETSAQAKAAFTRACDAGYARGCSDLGFYLVTEGDVEAGQALLREACEAGVGNACWGASNEEEEAEARFAWYSRGCTEAEPADPQSCYKMAEAYRLGLGTKRSAASAYRLYGDLCDGGLGMACNRRGQAKERGSWGLTPDQEEALALYERACALDFDWGCANVGHLLVDGVGGSTRLAEGRALLETACDEGKAVSCWELGALEMSEGLEHASTQAAWDRVEAACESGGGEACAWLGAVQWTGFRTGAPDPASAVRSWTRACEEDEHPEACLMLGNAVAERGGDPRARTQQACDLELSLACRILEDPLARAELAEPAPWLPRPAGVTQRSILAGAFAERSVQQCLLDLGRPCHGAFARQLMGYGEVDAEAALPWEDALAAGCEAGDDLSCLVTGRLAAGDGDAATASAAFSRGCGPEGAAALACDELVATLADHRRALDATQLLDARASLCATRGGDWCGAAARGYKRTGDAERRATMLRFGCLDRDPTSCRAYERLAGAALAPRSEGAHLTAEAALEQPLASPSETGGATMVGPLDRAALEAVVDGAAADVEACRVRTLGDDASQAGRVEIALVIGDLGTVAGTRIAWNDLGQLELAQCLEQTVRGWTFPPAGGPVRVQQAFDFGEAEPE